MKTSSADLNSNLNKAKIRKDNELYTRVEDIESEILNSGLYEHCFENKSVLCNCNDAEKSGFWRFFKNHFEDLGLKKLTAVSYKPNGHAQTLTYNGEATEKQMLNGDGSFSSQECIQLLNKSDIACTNPPFSLFIQYILLLSEYNKDFLLIGNINEMVCKDIFPMFQNGNIRYGMNMVKTFNGSTGTQTFGNIGWFTNIGDPYIPKPIVLSKSYSLCDNRDDEYPKYDGYDAIDIGHVKDIPYDYYGKMGVPLSFLTKYNPDQFELIGVDRYTIPKEFLVGGRAAVNGKGKFPRIIIKRKM